MLVWRAAAALGVPADAEGPATAAGLVDFGAQVRFRRPLVRSAVYLAAEPDERRRVHRALADVTDADADPDRRAWHVAQATAGLDEDVAAELERSATPARALVAARSKHLAGAADAALRLLAMARAGPLDELEDARAQLLHAQITFAMTRGRDAPPLLIDAAKRLEPLDANLARETYLEAFAAALSADRFVQGGDAGEVAAAWDDLAARQLELARPCRRLFGVPARHEPSFMISPMNRWRSKSALAPASSFANA